MSQINALNDCQPKKQAFNNEQHERLFLKEYNYCRLTILQFGRTRKELVTVSFN